MGWIVRGWSDLRVDDDGRVVIGHDVVRIHDERIELVRVDVVVDERVVGRLLDVVGMRPVQPG